MRPYKSFVLLFPPPPWKRMQALTGRREMKGRVIYKCIKIECTYEGAVFPAIVVSS